jgi:glutamine synthetase
MAEKRNDRHLSMAELLERIDTGSVDTVVVAFTDMQGRLQGKRLHGRYFADVVVEHGTPDGQRCGYLRTGPRRDRQGVRVHG